MVRGGGKHYRHNIDGTPAKRLFLSIISDYDLQTGLCELIDNAIDLWVTNNKAAGFEVVVELNVDRQLISVSDNAGGVRETDLRLLVAPGASSNDDASEVIGIFGVGGKRAGVALGELVEIRTRYKSEKSFQIDINNGWLDSDDWTLAAFEVADIPRGTTIVDIAKLRQPFNVDDTHRIFEHLGETYSRFLYDGCRIMFNGKLVKPLRFDAWAFPPDFPPQTMTFEVQPTNRRDETIAVKITGGLITDRDPETENYGVYFYCNDRLIVKSLRTRDVGYYVTSEAGVPHPDASLCRVIVELQGSGRLMPWNSSKSGLNFNHPTFTLVRARLIELVKYFTSLSRRLKRDWPGEVYSHRAGSVQKISEEDIVDGRKIALPKLPSVRKGPRIDEIKAINSKVLRDQPWTLGLVESLGLVDIIFKQNLETKNRAALVLLDSNFEIALKEFIVNRSDLFKPHIYNDAKIADIFKARQKVIAEVVTHISLSKTLLNKVSHFYGLRNKLIHERASVGITDTQVKDYQATIEIVLKKLFNLKFPND